MKPRVPLFVVALLIGASTWTMHRSTADAQPERAPEPRVPAAPLMKKEDAVTPAARPVAYSAASLEVIAARSQNR